MKRSLIPFFLVGSLAITAVLPASGPIPRPERTAVAPDPDPKSISVDSLAQAAADSRQVERFYGQLLADYGYRPAIDPVSSFFQDAPALTPEAAALAFRQAGIAAAGLSAATAKLEALVSDFEANKISSPDFEAAVAANLAQIELFAGQIQGDIYVAILDRMLDHESGADLPQPGREAARLRHLADEVQKKIDSYAQPQRVQAADLRHPSLTSMAASIQQLTQSLRTAPQRAAR